jgi:hypothetical protein
MQGPEAQSLFGHLRYYKEASMFKAGEGEERKEYLGPRQGEPFKSDSDFGFYF